MEITYGIKKNQLQKQANSARPFAPTPREYAASRLRPTCWKKYVDAVESQNQSKKNVCGGCLTICEAKTADKLATEDDTRDFRAATLKALEAVPVGGADGQLLF